PTDSPPMAKTRPPCSASRWASSFRADSPMLWNGVSASSPCPSMTGVMMWYSPCSASITGCHDHHDRPPPCSSTTAGRLRSPNDLNFTGVAPSGCACGRRGMKFPGYGIAKLFRIASLSRSPEIHFRVWAWLPFHPRPFQVERQQAAQDFLLVERAGLRVVQIVVIPAVGGEHGTVELLVQMLQPRRHGVVKVGQRARLERRDLGVGRVEPRLALLVKLARRLRDGLIARVVHRLGPRRPGQRERLEGGGGRVAGAALQLCTLPKCPQFVGFGVQHAEEVVIIAGEDDYLVIGQDVSVKPHK